MTQYSSTADVDVCKSIKLGHMSPKRQTQATVTHKLYFQLIRDHATTTNQVIQLLHARSNNYNTGQRLQQVTQLVQQD